MFKRRAHPPINISPSLLQQARHWRMGGRSSDAIRQGLMQRGISWETSLAVIDLLDAEQRDEGRISLGRRAPPARSWLLGYLLFIGLGAVPVLSPFGRNAALCQGTGLAAIGIGLMGLVIYAVNWGW